MKAHLLPISITCHLALGVLYVQAFHNIWTTTRLTSCHGSVDNQRSGRYAASWHSPTRLLYSDQHQNPSGPSLDRELAKIWSGSMETVVDNESQDVVDDWMEGTIEPERKGNEMDAPSQDVPSVFAGRIIAVDDMESNNYEPEHLWDGILNQEKESSNGWTNDTPEYYDDDDHDAVTTINSDTNTINRWSSSAERRQQRMQSLNSFNQLNNHKNSKQKHEQEQSQTNTHIIPRQSSPKLLFHLPTNDQSQLQAIQSNAPAILLSSGPGTGKSHVLSLRIAYLLRMQLEYESESGSSTSSISGTSNHYYQGQPIPTGISTTPDSMVILSFTNKDAERLKENALDYMFSPNTNNEAEATKEWREQTSKQLWSGTMHVFALAILRKYGYSAAMPLRVLPARAMRSRVSQSLRSLLNGGGGEDGHNNNDIMDGEHLDLLRMRHLKALHDVGQSRSILYQNIVKCIDLWKEALLIPSMSQDVMMMQDDGLALEDLSDEQHRQQLDRQMELELRDDCVELAMRLGIPESSALLALDVFPAYQARHAAAGTADPSDLAGMAYRLLLANSEALHLLRAKLKHIIVDEYQDVSVSQHALLRLVVRGKTDDDFPKSISVMDDQINVTKQLRSKRSPILLDSQASSRRETFKKKPRTRSSNESLNQSFNVPNLFAAGDTKQSIYGWRAAAPSLTVDGFRRDYPQGVVASLGTCYRLPKDIYEASSMLLDQEEECIAKSYDISPAAAKKLVSSVEIGRDSDSTSFPIKKDSRLGESLLLSKGLQKLDSTVLIHGLWDSREEYKYIASTIRRRSKERRKAFISAMNEVDSNLISDEDQLDVTDVAVMVRSSSQIDLLKETLTAYGIPFIVAGENIDSINDEKEHMPLLARTQNKAMRCIPMKPAMVMTMHRSKGEEFDDVYLTGWSEGSFPHPDAVSSNLVHEERRLGYVALTRARQRVVITHSLMSRTLHYSKDGSKKYVTCQVQPSRFLYELVPSKKRVDGILDDTAIDDEPFLKDNEGTVWNRNAGVKEYVAGQNVPDYFQKAYQQPKHSVSKRADLRRHTSVNISSPFELSKLEPQNKIDPAREHIYFKVGEKVVVTNEKHKHYEKTGIVLKVSKCFVSFRESETRQTLRIKPSFLQLAVARQDGFNLDFSPPKTLITDDESKTSNGLSKNETERLEARLAQLTVQQLKSRLKRLKLPVSGKKSQLISRLLGR